MRTKGDTFSTVRMAINNVQLGQYIIPKGFPSLPLICILILKRRQC
jgi:hypothetical protein